MVANEFIIPACCDALHRISGGTGVFDNKKVATGNTVHMHGKQHFLYNQQHTIILLQQSVLHVHVSAVHGSRS